MKKDSTKKKGPTEQDSFFAAARRLQEGQSAFKDFPSKESANAFRVKLYKVRNKLEDYTVDISIEGSRVLASKARRFTSYGIIDENGVETTETITLKTLSDKVDEKYQEELAEILQSAEELELPQDKKEEYIQELTDSLNFRYERISNV